MSGVAGFVAKWTATMLIIDVSHASTKHQSASSTAPSQNTVMFISIAKSIGTIIMKKRSERRKHCALAVVVCGDKNFRPATDPLSGGATAKI